MEPKTGIIVVSSVILVKSFCGVRSRTWLYGDERLADAYHATASQIALAWMMNKRPGIVPIPGTRHLCRLKENIGAADIRFTEDDVSAIDKALDHMEMSEVFGGSPVKTP